MDDNMKIPSINNTLFMAIAQRQPDTHKLLWHICLREPPYLADRAWHYPNESQRKLLG